MKRSIAILFLAVFLFNLVGYYAVYFGLCFSADQAFRQQLDEHAYDDNETATVKIPFTLPYQTDWDSFERVDGNFEKDGQSYNLIEQKVERDTLIVVYIKDHKATSLLESLTEFVHASTDSPLAKKAGQLMKTFAKDYIGTRNEIQVASTGWSLDKPFPQPHYTVGCFFGKIASPPPKG